MTHAEIIAKKRKYADEIERKAQEYIARSERVPGAYQSGIVYNIRSEADRLETAHKREVDALKQRCVELDAEVAAKDEVIKRLNDAIAEEQRRKMAATENSSAVGDGDKSKAPDPVAYAIEGFKKDPAIMQMYEQMNVGNLAKLREALSDMLNAAFVVILRHDNATEEMGRLALCADNAKAALAEPPRNCDKYPTFNDAIRALADKRGWHDAKWDSERYCILAQWLYAPATEKEGGAK